MSLINHTAVKRRLLLLFTLFLTSCQVSHENPTSHPLVVATFLTAELTGTLIEGGGCIRVNSGTQSYGLVFPPDTTMTQNGDTVTIEMGLVTDDRREVRLRLGERGRLGGGATDALPTSLAERVDAACTSPYWVIGARIERVP